MGYEWTEFFWIPKRQECGFVFTSFRELNYGPNEEEFYGPYVVPDSGSLAECALFRPQCADARSIEFAARDHGLKPLSSPW